MAVLPANLKDNVLYSHGGLTYGGFFTAPDTKQHHINECIKALVVFLKEHNITHFIYKSIPYIYFNIPAEEYLWPFIQAGAKLTRVDISTVIDLNNPIKIAKGRKAQSNRAKREGVIIKPSNDFDTFIRLENEILQKFHHTKAVHSSEELLLLQQRFPENIELWVAEYQGQIIAGTVLFIYDNVVHTQYMAANEKAREIGGLDFLITTLIARFTDKKRWFDFGISTEQNGKVFNEGLCAQKEGFGGRTAVYNLYEWRV